MKKTPAMREADQAYLLHHGTCPTCIAAGKGYGQRCPTGVGLWQAYERAWGFTNNPASFAVSAAPSRSGTRPTSTRASSV